MSIVHKSVVIITATTPTIITTLTTSTRTLTLYARTQMIGDGDRGEIGGKKLMFICY
jgi:hypothetical protein